jgi:hypothetical protein
MKHLILRQTSGRQRILSMKIVVIFLCLLSVGCPLGGKDTARSTKPNARDEMVPVGPEVKAGLVIYYKTGVADEQIEDFINQVLSKPHPSGIGTIPRDGIRGPLRVFPPVQGHEATAVTFFPNATTAQREELKADAISHPIVYKVLENVAPKDVKTIE